MCAGAGDKIVVAGEGALEAVGPPEVVVAAALAAPVVRGAADVVSFAATANVVIGSCASLTSSSANGAATKLSPKTTINTFCQGLRAPHHCFARSTGQPFGPVDQGSAYRTQVATQLALVRAPVRESPPSIHLAST